jgi:uncharacterized alpha-E superfamily protein
MLSREAEALYWVGRYLERVEMTARWFDVEYHSRLEGEADEGAVLPWPALLAGRGEAFDYSERYSDWDEASLLQFLVLDRANPNSIRSCITAARENARGLRGQIASEMWEHLNRVYLELGEQTGETVHSRTPHELLQWVKCACWLFDGIAERTMLRGEGWQFFRCGKFLERAEATARLLDGMAISAAIAPGSRLQAPSSEPGHPAAPLVRAAGRAWSLEPGAIVADLHRWTALLKSAGAYEAFWKTHAGITPADVVTFILFHARFPGSVRYALTRVDQCLRWISGVNEGDDENEAVRCAGRFLAALVHVRVCEALADLHTYLTAVVGDAATLHEAIVRTFFSHLAWRPWEAEEPETEFAMPAPRRRQMVAAAQQ